MKKIIGIYKLTSPSGKCYIGQSKNIYQRYREHKRDTKHKHNKLYYALKKYGYESFTKEIIEECDKNILDERERHWIKHYDSVDNGYNCDYGGQIHKEFSKEHKEKLRNAFLGKYNGNQNIEFYIDDILYTSIGDANKKLNIPNKTIHNRLNSTNIEYKNYRYKDPSLIPVRRARKYASLPFIINGVMYNSLREASEKLNITPSTLMRKLKSGKIPNSSYIIQQHQP
jgi:hypothetical protein